MHGRLLGKLYIIAVKKKNKGFTHTRIGEGGEQGYSVFRCLSVGGDIECWRATITQSGDVTQASR